MDWILNMGEGLGKVAQDAEREDAMLSWLARCLHSGAQWLQGTRCTYLFRAVER